MRKRLLAVITILSVTVMSTGCIKVIDKGTEGQYTGKTVFNAEESVEGLWDDVVSDITGNAVQLETLLSEANGKLTSVAEVYGVNGKSNYPVKGIGVVEVVETSKSAGYIVIKLDNYAGSEEIRVQVGPTFKNKDVIGDTQTVTGFKDYTNQTEWGKIKDALIDKVSSEVIAPVEIDSLQGKTVEFVGAFTASTGSSDILIVPVSLTVK